MLTPADRRARLRDLLARSAATDAAAAEALVQLHRDGQALAAALLAIAEAPAG